MEPSLRVYSLPGSKMRILRSFFLMEALLSFQ